MASNLPPTRAAKRRSIRMALSAPIGVSWNDPVGRTLKCTAKAHNLNLYGAAIRLGQDLPIGIHIVVRHPRGSQKSARVVSLVRSIAADYIYGIEFLPVDTPAIGFWGIHFPEAPQLAQSRPESSC